MHYPKKTEARIFRAWEEEREKVPIGPNGDDILEARLVRKYGGLRWLDQDNGYRICEAHPDRMFFQKRRGNNKYLIFATYQGYDLTKQPEQHWTSMMLGRKVIMIFMTRSSRSMKIVMKSNVTRKVRNAIVRVIKNEVRGG